MSVVPLRLQAKADGAGRLRLDIAVAEPNTEYTAVVVAWPTASGPVAMPLTLVLGAEVQCEEDGRWFAEIIERPGAFAHGATREEAVNRAAAVALRLEADRLEGLEDPGPVE